jgi:DNA polymerase I-like protein with 3'-5' exonuclease and polymerase domains
MNKLEKPLKAMDTETFLIRPGHLAPQMVVVGIHENNGPTQETQRLYHANNKLQDGMSASGALNELWCGKYTVAGHNLAFDAAVNISYDSSLALPIFDAYRAGRAWDTSIGDKLAHITAGWFKYRPSGGKPRFRLSDLVERTFHQKMEGKTTLENGDDPWRLRYSELIDIPVKNWPDSAVEYAKKDVFYTQKLAELQAKHADKLVTWSLQANAAFALHLMSCWGLRTDEERVEALGISLRATQKAGRKTLIDNGLLRTGKGSKNMKVIRDLVEESYFKLGQQAPETDKGAVATSKKVLEESKNPLLMGLAELSSTEKLISSFLPVIESGIHEPINPGYNILVESGRTSSFKPNVQQLPRKGGVRECFIPRPGYVYVAADYSVAELCSLAQVLLTLFGKSKMADALVAGKDLHIHTAATLLQKPYKRVEELYYHGDKEVEETRQLAKVLNFGLPGGLGYKTFVGYAQGFGLNITLQESKRARDMWFAEYPEMSLYFNWISRLCRMGKYQSVHPVTGFIRGDMGYTDGANHNFQHLTATGAKEALFNIAYECYADPASDLYGSRPVLFIHDEVIMESPISRANAAAIRLTEVMEDSMGMYLKDIPCKAEAAMMRRWYKGAKPVFNNYGELIPWEPKK